MKLYPLILLLLSMSLSAMIPQSKYEMGRDLVDRLVKIQKDIGEGKVASPQDISIAVILINKGADINLHAPDFFDPRKPMVAPALYHAIRIKNLDILKALVNNGVDLNAKIPDANGQDSSPIVEWAKLKKTDEQNALEITKFFMEHGADLNAQDSSGHTILMYAAGKGFPEMVKLLIDGLPYQKPLEKYKDINALRSQNDNYYLQLLPEGVLQQALTYLVNKADPNVKDKKGLTALDHAQKNLKNVPGHQSDRLLKFLEVIKILEPITNK